MKNERAVKGVIVKNGKFLVLEQEVEGEIFYTLPGGRINEADPEGELKREVKEETGLSIEVKEKIGSWFFIRADGTKTVCDTFLCEPLTNEIHHNKSEQYEKIRRFLWIDKEEFLEGPYSKNESLRNLISKLNI